MKKNFSSKLAGQIGESLVVSELGRRNIVATSFTGNVPDIDLLAYKDRKTLHIQVKAWKSGAASVDATRYLDISFEEDGRQIINGLADGLDNDLVYVFVSIGVAAGQDKYYILQQRQLAESLQAGYQQFLDKHSGKRPRNPSTTHSSVGIQHLQAYEGEWRIIENHFA